MARNCTQCGAELRDGIAFCTECGAKVAAPQPPQQAAPPTSPAAPVYQASPPRQPVYQAPPPQQPVYQQPVQPAPQQTLEQSVQGTKYEPITTGGFIGIMLLLCIPILGFILLIVWACGGCRKISKRSFARATLILTVIMTVISLILGLVFGSLIQSLLKNAGVDTSGLGQSSWFSGDAGSEDDSLSDLGELGALLEGLMGQDGSGDGWDALIDGVENANQDAEANSDGWPKALREYPGGTATAVASYRTEISGTTLEEMKAYIEELKKDGYQYQDFYDFGFSEEDMLAMNGWWGTNGEIYLGISFAEGTVTVDHTYELPDLSFG